MLYEVTRVDEGRRWCQMFYFLLKKIGIKEYLDLLEKPDRGLIQGRFTTNS